MAGDHEITVPHTAEGAPLRGLRVRVLNGPGADAVSEAAGDHVTVGSAPGNDLVLSDPGVSRYHLELRTDGDRILLVDHGSTNGTWVGGTRIERGWLSEAATIRLGRTTLELSAGSEVRAERFERGELFGVLGSTLGMSRLLARVSKVAASDVSVLLVGETGTGKEVLARAIHEASPRCDQPFEIVDCGSLIPTLIASELFGHERGAFTGANEVHQGAFERADGGTIFLDEIGELPLSLQPGLLGVLERRAFRRVGGKQMIDTNVRVVAATHRDLRQEVNAERFRQDLYYRLAVVFLEVPPLRERSEDIPILIEHFLREAGRNESHLEIVPGPVLSALQKHHWPGNVRELRNFVESTLALGEPMFGGTRSQDAPAGAPQIPVLTDLLYKDAREKILRAFDATYLRAVLEENEGNVSMASRRAGIHRSYFTRLLKQAGSED